MAKTHWRVLDGKLWKYAGYRSGTQNAYRFARSLRYRDYRNPLSTKLHWVPEESKYFIYTRPREFDY